jgi:glycosyltransferase involved in cell wall biosynthesis
MKAFNVQDNNPLVSVIVPSYNHALYIENCIKSIVNQSYKNIQLIVIDDGSKDNSVDILTRLSQDYNFTFVSQKNIGLSATLNKGIKDFAKGKYLTIVASDDWWLPNKIETQVKFLSEHTQYKMCYGKANVVDENGVIKYTYGNAPKTTDFFKELINATEGSFIPVLTVMYDRDIHHEVGYYDEQSYIEDWDMHLRIAYKYPIGFINESLACYRYHGNNMSSNTVKMMNSLINIVKKWNHLSDYNEIIKNWELIAFRQLAKNYKKEARKYLLTASKSFYKAGFWRGVFNLILG